MKFFIPHKDSLEQDPNIYQKTMTFYSKVKKHLEEAWGATLSDRKVRSLSYQYKGKHLTAKIGKKDELEDEKVLMTFYEQEKNQYYICTENRGAITGTPILVGGDRVNEFEDFGADNT